MIGRLIKSELRLDKAKAIFALIKLTLAANPGSPKSQLPDSWLRNA